MRNRLPSAFTLIEIIIVLGLFSVMFLALIQFFVSYNTSYMFERAVVSTSSSAGTLMNEIAAMTLPATQVLASHTFGGTTYSSGNSALVLELPSVDSSGAIISGAYDYVAFYVDGVRAYEIVAANAGSTRKSRTRQLSDTIQSLSFTYNGASYPETTKVTIDIVTRATFVTRSTETHLQQQVYLRNTTTP